MIVSDFLTRLYMPLSLDAIAGLRLAGLHSAGEYIQVEAWSAAWPIERAALNGVESE